MSPYIIFTDNNTTYCLQQAAPHYLAVFESTPGGVISREIKDGSGYLNFRGTLAANRIGNDLKAAEKIMTAMADWFWIYRSRRSAHQSNY